jgi:hypothetical protein
MIPLWQSIHCRAPRRRGSTNPRAHACFPSWNMKLSAGVRTVDREYIFDHLWQCGINHPKAQIIPNHWRSPLEFNGFPRVAGSQNLTSDGVQDIKEEDVRCGVCGLNGGCRWASRIAACTTSFYTWVPLKETDPSLIITIMASSHIFVSIPLAQANSITHKSHGASG